MTQKVLHGLAFLLCLGMAGSAIAQDAMRVVDATTTGMNPATMSVNMDNAQPVQGFVIAIGYDNAMVEVTAVDVAGAATAAGAELVVGEIFHAEGGFTLGVVLDAGAPFDGQTIAAGTDQQIAAFDVSPLISAATDTPTGFNFVDDTFNSPVLSNILVQAGLSIGAAQGLGLEAGTLTLMPVPPTLTIENTSSLPGGGNTAVRILMDNPQDVQGFVLAIDHTGGPALTGINIAGTATDAAGAEFVVDNIAPVGGVGGTLGVVLDFDAPFDGQSIAAGSNHIANFVYDCPTLPSTAPAQTSALSFVDGVLGSPALDNVIVVGGLSISPVLVNGELTCVPPTIDIIEGNITYQCSGGEGTPGSTVDVCFYYTSDINLQGFQLAVCFDCNLNFGEFSIAGSIAEAVGAEFVNYNVDNDPDDGDGCEFVAGILLDALPPFEGQTVPQTLPEDPLLIGCIDAQIKDTAPCDALLPITFCDGINGAGSVPISNVVVAEFQSVPVDGFGTCGVLVSPVATFVRGDCTSDGIVNIADSAAILGEQFFGLAVQCEDACDFNDDGKINLADSVATLNYLFKFGDEPPAPGPITPGEDPTDDGLTCDTAGCL